MIEKKEIIIIGCGAGGSTSAQFARKANRKSSVTIFEKDKYPQYSKCGLPYVISGKIKHYNDLIEFNENWYNKANIDLNLNSEITGADFENKIIYVKKNNKLLQKKYDKLIIATGSIPNVPPIKKISKDNYLNDGIFVIRTLDDAKKIDKYIKKGKNATIIGAGLIGLEMADSLFKKGMNVNIIEYFPHILPKIFDEDLSKLIKEKINRYITIFTNFLAKEIEIVDGKINKLYIKNNENSKIIDIKTDILIIATGTKPSIPNFCKGLKIGKTGGIVVNNKCETSFKNVYAVGDCTEYIDFITKKSINVGLGSIVVRQGISAGINASGGNYELPDGLLQTCTSEFFNIQVAAVGPSKEYLKDISIINAKYNGSSLPNYFPGGKDITIKISINKKNQEIISGQAIGDKAAQRINTIACAILNKMKIEQFGKLETAYAPAISPTLDATKLTCDIIVKKINRNQ
jgi:NADH oxidase (H2O2-forming)